MIAFMFGNAAASKGTVASLIVHCQLIVELSPRPAPIPELNGCYFEGRANEQARAGMPHSVGLMSTFSSVYSMVSLAQHRNNLDLGNFLHRD